MIKPLKLKKDRWKKIFAIIVILLFLGVVLAVALVNIDYLDILKKIP